MGTPYLGELKLVSFDFAPKNWAFCNGQFLPINQNQALFSILGTTYGGNGQTTFALPDLRGRTAVHWGSTVPIGAKLGEEAHTLTLSEMPQHLHLLQAYNGPADTAATATSPIGNSFAIANAVTTGGSVPVNMYGTAPTQTLGATALSSVGGSQAHENMQPYLTLNWVIALQGIFPSRN